MNSLPYGIHGQAGTQFEIQLYITPFLLNGVTTYRSFQFLIANLDYGNVRFISPSTLKWLKSEMIDCLDCENIESLYAVNEFERSMYVSQQGLFEK